MITADMMIVTATIRDLILDQNRTSEIKEYIAEGREQYGMQTFDQHLMDLVGDDIVDFNTAMANASNPSDFELQMKTLRRRSKTTKAVTGRPSAPSPAPPRKDEKPLGLTDDLSNLLQP